MVKEQKMRKNSQSFSKIWLYGQGRRRIAKTVNTSFKLDKVRSAYERKKLHHAKYAMGFKEEVSHSTVQNAIKTRLHCHTTYCKINARQSFLKIQLGVPARATEEGDADTNAMNTREDKA